MSERQIWRGEYGIETAATADIIWQIFRDVPDGRPGCRHRAYCDRWAFFDWNLVHDEASGEDPLRSGWSNVRENECFVYETRFGDLVVTVATSH